MSAISDIKEFKEVKNKDKEEMDKEKEKEKEKEKDDLNLYLKQNMNMNMKITLIPDSSRSFQCPYCGLSFPCISKLGLHMWKFNTKNNKHKRCNGDFTELFIQFKILNIRWSRFR